MRLKTEQVKAGAGSPVKKAKKGRHFSTIPETKIHHTYPAIMPGGLILTKRIPWDCTCKWDSVFNGAGQTTGEFRLKFYNTSCPAKRKGNHD